MGNKEFSWVISKEKNTDKIGTSKEEKLILTSWLPPKKPQEFEAITPSIEDSCHPKLHKVDKTYKQRSI